MLITIISVVLLLSSSAQAMSEWKVPLEYSVEDAQFHSLGSISVRKMFDGNYSGEFLLELKGLEKVLADSLRKSAVSNARGLEPKKEYRIRSGNLYSSSNPCLFLLADLDHEIVLTVDSERQYVHSITIYPGQLHDLGDSDNEPYCNDVDQLKSSPATKLNVHVSVISTGELPGPDTASYLQRIEDEKKARQHGATTDNRSFIAKYWMYIVPVVIFMVVSNVFNSDQQQGGE